jgi:hypothetical protein
MNSPRPESAPSLAFPPHSTSIDGCASCFRGCRFGSRREDSEEPMSKHHGNFTTLLPCNKGNEPFLKQEASP